MPQHPRGEGARQSPGRASSRPRVRQPWATFYVASSRLNVLSRPRRGATSTSQGHPRTIFRRALERGNLVLAEVTAREIGRVTIAEALELTALVARKQPERYGRFAAHWLCLYLEEHEKATLEEVAVLVSKLRALAIPQHHASSLAILRKAARPR